MGTKPTGTPFKTPEAIQDAAERRAASTDFFTFQYRHRESGKVETRRVAKDGATLVRLVDPGYEHEAGFFLTGHCMDRNAMRSFALVNMVGQITIGGNTLLVTL
jgi:hypothetical protein